jgi:hypothetical protein
MKNKLRLLLCFLLICAFVPMNYTFAAIPDRSGDGIHIDDIVYYLSQTGSLSNSQIGSLLDQIAPIISRPTAGEVAAGITSVTEPAADETSLTLPTVPIGYTIAINDSSEIGVIRTNGTIAPPATATPVNLVFTVTRTSDSTTANTGTIAVTVPANGGIVGYTYCANENDTCSFSGTSTVAFGANDSFYYLTVTSRIPCTNPAFGGDPIGGVYKSCYYKIIISPTIGQVATGVKFVTAPAADGTSLILPTVPNGYTIAINTSSDTGVIGTNGVITPPATATPVNLVFKVTRTSDNAIANSGIIAVRVPAHS